MRQKTINAILNAKFNQWAKSIKDEKVRKLVEKNSIITGGCIASMLLGEKVNDFDVYFRNKETVLAVAKYYLEIFNKERKESGFVLDGATMTAEDIEKGKYGGVGQNMTPDRVKIVFASKGVAGEAPEEDRDLPVDSEILDALGEVLDEKVETESKEAYQPVFISPNAITLSGKIQIVIRFYGEPDTIHENYDYVHCTNYWTSDSGKVTLRQPALESLMARELVYIGSKYPVASLIRTRKFVQRGWVINAGQYLKMCFQVAQLDLSKPAVLEDQLVGVDFAYFDALINALKAQIKRNSESSDIEVRLNAEQVEYNYLTTIIDKMF